MSDDNQIVLLDVPRWTESPGGGWTRVWTVSFDQPVTAEAAAVIDGMATPALAVRARGRAEDPCVLDLETRVASDPLSDENFYYSTYRLLRRIHDEVGALTTIQGVPRQQWAPFRAGRAT